MRAPAPPPLIWRSDGSVSGTILLKNLVPSFTMAVLNGVLFFPGSTAEHGTELWKSDGTESGTVPLKDVETRYIAGFNGKAFFNGYDEDSGQGAELWVSDGTEAGTVLFKDINYGPNHSNPHGMQQIAGNLFFYACPGSDTHTFTVTNTGNLTLTLTGTTLIAEPASSAASWRLPSSMASWGSLVAG